MTSQYWVDASQNTTAFTVRDNRGREGAEHVMKPGAACRLRQQSFPFFPRDSDGALAHLSGETWGAGAPPLQLGATVRVQIRAVSLLTAPAGC